MIHNGALAIIFMFLLTSLPLFGFGIKCQFLVHGATAPGSKVDLYSKFKEQLNATSNFAESEYDARTSDALGLIYYLTGDILSQQLKQAQTKSDSQNAVASSLTCTAGNADDIAAEESPQLINNPVIVSTAGKFDQRQARKIQKASRILRHSPLRMKNLYPRTSTERRQSSRLLLPSFPKKPDAAAGRGKLSTISSQSLERPYYAVLEQQQQIPKNIDNYTTLRGTGNSLNNGLGKKMNGLAVQSIGREFDGDITVGDGNDDSNKPFRSASIKRRKKLQIDGRQNNLRKSRSWLIPFGKEQSDGLIQSDKDIDEGEMKDKVREFSLENLGTHKCKRNTDSFPEVFARPLPESVTAKTAGTANELNDVLRNTNSLLASVQGVSNNSIEPIINFDDSNRRIGKQIQILSEAALNGPNTAVTHSATTIDASAANLTNVMEKVLDELESLKECKEADEMQPEGSPCDIAGSWNSETIGLQFHMSIANPSASSRTFVEGKIIDIELTERVPPRRHDLMGCDWFLTGSTVKQVGGPFYMTAQKADRFIVATFAGLCKTCGGIPTIFGSWTFVYPAKDCQDISLAVETKRDVLRRDTLEAKRKHRRDRFRLKDKGKCSHSLF